MARSAGFLGKQHADKARAKIQSSHLVTRLGLNAMGQLTNPDGEPIEMTPGQIKSAEILLRKTVPDLSAVSLEGDMAMNGALNIKITKKVIK
jgi:hypothetical protein